MQPTTKSWILALALSLTVVAGAGSNYAYAANAETDDIDEGVIAKMARHRSKPFFQKDGSGGDEGSSFRRSTSSSIGECGSLNVGNVVTTKRTGNPREVNVYVRGDVINANNRCR